MPSTAVVRRRGGRGLYPAPADRRQKSEEKSSLPEYLEPGECEAVIRRVDNRRARLAALMQWRAGLRVSEAVAVCPSDVHLTARPPDMRVRMGKGRKDRLVPLHVELARALEAAIGYSRLPTDAPIVGYGRQWMWKQIKEAVMLAQMAGELPYGKRVGTHTLRHSAARHWLKTGVPVNVIQLWLGHSQLSTTMRYLRLLSDPGGWMEIVP